MADLGPSHGQRGQLLLVFAIGLAVLFVALALILNAGVSAEIMATQSNHGIQEERSALEYEESVRSGVAGLIQAVNTQNASSDAEVVENLALSVDEWNELSRQFHAADGAVTNATLVGVTEGTLIQHTNETMGFTNRSGTADWTVVSDSTEIRGFRMNLTQDQLQVRGSACENCFSVTIDDGETTWELHVYRRTGEGDPIVIEDPSTGETCSTANESSLIDLTAGTFEDEPCSALEFPGTMVGPHTVKFSNADHVRGTYELTVAGAIPQDPHFSQSNSPSLAPVIYSATVSVSYRSTTLIYETEIRIETGGS